jgi:hypothetical protein
MTYLSDRMWALLSLMAHGPTKVPPRMTETLSLAIERGWVHAAIPENLSRPTCNLTPAGRYAFEREEARRA